ncbi:hypothetical protein [Phytohabitans suffuscus]|uniref:Uncharacterized protein n=1 Tax=Phytohabitans suffuscus TaxID=624315 RepID=A0A6F8YII6_9ACTN|nr:hypothetical protein [Phytohabitans suffuscus]BCB85890.1 hypothetical protein Psuf_032030 [Phytohabitans suffuscus]
MIRKLTAPPRVSRHPYSTRGLSLRILLLGVMLTSLAIALAGGQPVGASSADGREPTSDTTGLADGGPMNGPALSGQTGPAPKGQTKPGPREQTGPGPSEQSRPGTSEQTGPRPSGQTGPASGAPSRAESGRASGSAAASHGGGIVPAASASPSTPSGAAAGAPPDDWHLYHHWTDPSWPDHGQAAGEHFEPGAAAPLPARTGGGGFGWEPPVTATADPRPSTSWTPTPADPTDPTDPTDPAPGTPSGPPTVTAPPPDPPGPGGEPYTPTPSRTADAPLDDPPPYTDGPPSGLDPQDSTDGSASGVLPPPATRDPLQRDPVAAGPDGDDLGLGGTVDDPTPTPTPEPFVTGRATAPLRAAQAQATPAGEYRHTLVYSGLVGLALAAIGLTMVGLRRRGW